VWENFTQRPDFELTVNNLCRHHAGRFLAMTIIGFKSKNDEVLDHWITFADGFSMSPQEFYTAVEKEMADRKIPSMEVSRVEHAEGGLLSGKRLYLRMIRERLAFDMCAAPFGNTFFFSCRTVHSPPVLRLWHIAVTFVFFAVVYSQLFKFLGLMFANIAIVALLIAIAETFRNAIGMGLADLDNALMKIPVVGPIYENWFRKETYYRQDTRLVYLKIVPEIIKQVADDVTGAKGIKLVQQYERAPIFGELYKRVPPKDKTP
jgi:hypothetical protein